MKYETVLDCYYYYIYYYYIYYITTSNPTVVVVSYLLVSCRPSFLLAASIFLGEHCVCNGCRSTGVCISKPG